MSEQFSKEYRDLYLDLQYMLRRGYYDVFFLRSVEDHKSQLQKNGTDQKPHVTHIMLGHLCELAKMDLCLTIWKFLFDKDSDANSLMSMNRMLRSHNDRSYESKLPKDMRHYENTINNFRNQGMAHNDRSRTLESITVAELTTILDHIRKMLNDMCDTSISPEVFPFTDESLHSNELRCRVSVRAMLKHDEN